MSMIKYNRVKKISPLGKFHGSFYAVWDAIPQSTIDGLTSKALVELVSAIWQSWENTKTLAKREVDTFDTYAKCANEVNNRPYLFKDGVFLIKTQYVSQNWSDYNPKTGGNNA